MSDGGQLVSILIPCYNQAHFLSEAIESALAQTHQNVEVVVVDDGSTDDTGAVAARYPTVRSMRQKNRGLAEARNAGFRASRGQYVLFLDADDRLTPNAVESHLSCFAKHSEAGFVVGDIDHISLDGSYAGSPRWPVLEANQYEELLKVNHIANTIAVMFRRSVIESLGGFRPSFWPGEDYDLLLRAAREFPSAHHQNVVACYRRHSTAVSRNGALMLQAMNSVMLMQWPNVKDDPGLTKAWHEGDRYWRDHFGLATVKQVCNHLRHGKLLAAARGGTALIHYVRGRLFLWPWILRKRAVGYFRRRLRTQRKPDGDPAPTIVSR